MNTHTVWVLHPLAQLPDRSTDTCSHCGCGPGLSLCTLGCSRELVMRRLPLSRAPLWLPPTTQRPLFGRAHNANTHTEQHEGQPSLLIKPNACDGDVCCSLYTETDPQTKQSCWKATIRAHTHAHNAARTTLALGAAIGPACLYPHAHTHTVLCDAV
jgi:hypothetical protein